MANSDTRAALRYHQQTKHSYHSVRFGSHTLDWSNRPEPFKVYSDADRVPLPDRWRESEFPALASLLPPDSPGPTRSVPDLEDLARLLYHSGGITKRKPYPGGDILFRAASCTGALYEIELYVVCGDLNGLPAGVYHFNPREFVLERLRSGDYRGLLSAAAGREPQLSRAPLTVVSTGTYWRNAWKYRARTYRHFGWDNGTVLANLLAMSRALGFSHRLVLGFVDQEVNGLLGLDTDREVALSLAAIGVCREEVSNDCPPLVPLPARTGAASGEVDYPEMREMHASTTIGTTEEASAWRGRIGRQPAVGQGKRYRLDPLSPDEIPKEPLEPVIRRRGSSRRFVQAPVSFQAFSTMLYYSAQDLSTDFLEPGGGLLNDWYVTANAVEGLPSGAYWLDRDRWELELLRQGSFRQAMGYLGLEQDLPAEASFDVFFMADLEPVLERFGNRGYRALQLEAGLLGGRLYLSAYAQRLGATGLTFYDDDVTAFFSPHARGKSAIFLMALGRGKRRELVSLG
ncbi:MAG: SagB/ThcOx family dehydrogenase [Acidobacteria bacterium]|nr:SagB/ThcOx family dehydrogenase [Acidobacteriota bacterium]